ncbi:1597_t:CDS:2, partial [Ambispora gerdemannii]
NGGRILKTTTITWHLTLFLVSALLILSFESFLVKASPIIIKSENPEKLLHNKQDKSETVAATSSYYQYGYDDDFDEDNPFDVLSNPSFPWSDLDDDALF